MHRTKVCLGGKILSQSLLHQGSTATCLMTSRDESKMGLNPFFIREALRQCGEGECAAELVVSIPSSSGKHCDYWRWCYISSGYRCLNPFFIREALRPPVIRDRGGYTMVSIPSSSGKHCDRVKGDLNDLFWRLNPFFIREALRPSCLGHTAGRNRFDSLNPFFIREALRRPRHLPIPQWHNRRSQSLLHQGSTATTWVRCSSTLWRVSIPSSSGKHCDRDNRGHPNSIHCCLNPFFIREALRHTCTTSLSVQTQSCLNPFFIREALRP